MRTKGRKGKKGSAATKIPPHFLKSIQVGPGIVKRNYWNPYRYKAMKYVYNAKMIDGSSVVEHVFNMIMNLNMAEIQGAVIDKTTQIILVLESLPKSFLPFKTDYIKNKLDKVDKSEFKLSQLLDELEMFESKLIEKRKSA